MSFVKKITLRHKRRTFRVRNNQHSRGTKMRISVYRSLNHIYAQIIDDAQQTTLVSFSSRGLKQAGSKKETAKKVGLELGKLASGKNIDSVFFDRGGYRFHGRIQALAEGLREAGLKF